MRRNRGVSGKQPTLGLVPSPEIVLGSGRVLDDSDRTPKPPHCHSSASSLDPIAMSEDEEEFIISQLIPSSPESPQGHASFQPEAQLPPLTLWKPSSIVEPRTSTLENIPADDVENGKPNATRISPVVFPSSMRATETVPDSTPDGSRRGMERSLAEDPDINIFLDAAPVQVDFSLSRHRLASREDGENEGQMEETSLWWCHPTFEARAIADIRRTLRASLPSDPSQDPSPIETGYWRAEVRQRRPGAQIWEEPLEDALGSAPLNRGLGLWPRSSGAAGRSNGTGANNSHTQNGADTEAVIANSHRSTPPPNLELPSQNRSPEHAQTTALPRLVREPRRVARKVLNISALTRRVTGKRRPDDAELMNKKDLPDWKRCTWCARRKVKCAPRVGSQPPYRCFHCEDGERECVPNKKDPRQHQLHPRLKIVINTTGATSPHRHPHRAGPSHHKDVAIPAPAPENRSLGAVRRTMRHNGLVRARLKVRRAELEADMAEHDLKVARKQKRLADEKFFAALGVLEGRTRTYA